MGTSKQKRRSAVKKTAHGESAPARGDATRHRLIRWLVPLAGVGLAALLGLAYPSVWAGLSARDTGGRQGTNTSKLHPKNAIRAEFEQVAEKLFATPGTEMYRHGSAKLRKKLRFPGLDWPTQVKTRVELTHALLQEGKNEDAISAVIELSALVSQRPQVLRNSPGLHRVRGLAYLRMAEQENCVNLHNRDCCLFPLKNGGVHTQGAPAATAAESYLAYLRSRPEDLEVRWLLNLTHMALGTYPDSVPSAYLIPEQGPSSSDDFPRFEDVALASGITRLNHAGGAVVGDLDGDGLLDIVLSSCAPDTSLVYYRNVGDGSFSDETFGSGLEDQLGGLNLVATDYDNDGDIDLFVLRGAWLHELGCIRNSLLRNDGGGSWTDVTRAAGLAEPAFPTQAAAWLDYDNDGDLDVYVGNESLAEFPSLNVAGAQRCDYPSNLFRNNGDGTFTDVAAAAGVTNDRQAKGVAAGDFNNDGFIDLYVSNIGVNRLYRNNGDGTFTDVGPLLGVTEPRGRSFATWFFDYDNDGNLDIFVGAYDQYLADQAAWHLGLPFRSAPPRLYRNKGDGTFADVTKQAGLWRPIQPMGAGFGDLDNDSFLDVYLATGTPDYEALVPNVMLRNVDGEKFEDVTVAGGFGNLQKGHGVAFADFDNDGDQDVLNELGGFYQGDAFYNTLYQNPGHDNRFLVLKLIGRQSNRLAYGARVRVVVDTPQGQREIHRAVGSVSSFGALPSRLEIGLGDATGVDHVDVHWPANGTRQRLVGLELNAYYTVTEGDAGARKFVPAARQR